jgi:hypothetical protein
MSAQSMKTTEIIIERDDVIVFRRREQIEMRGCDVCGTEVEMWPPEMAAIASGVGTREIYRLIDQGQLHFAENAVGLLLLCSQSLKQVFPTHAREASLLEESLLPVAED